MPDDPDQYVYQQYLAGCRAALSIKCFDYRNIHGYHEPPDRQNPQEKASMNAVQTTSDAISWASLINLITPIAVVVLGVLLKSGLTLVADKVHDWTGVQISKDASDKANTYIDAHAGAWVAAAEDHVAGTAVIHVDSPLIANMANQVIKDIPQELADAGISTDMVKVKLAGAIGALQARMSGQDVTVNAETPTVVTAPGATTTTTMTVSKSTAAPAAPPESLSSQR